MEGNSHCKLLIKIRQPRDLLLVGLKVKYHSMSDSENLFALKTISISIHLKTQNFIQNILTIKKHKNLLYQQMPEKSYIKQKFNQ
jgi:hypothetical protein